MAELVWALGIALALAAIGATAAVPWDVLVQSGTHFMLACATIALPIEALYYALLYQALRVAQSAPPAGWYWRPFEHHHLLDAVQRRRVLPFFYAGALGFLGISLGIGLVLLGFVAAVRQG